MLIETIKLSNFLINKNDNLIITQAGGPTLEN